MVAQQDLLGVLAVSIVVAASCIYIAEAAMRAFFYLQSLDNDRSRVAGRLAGSGDQDAMLPKQ